MAIERIDDAAIAAQLANERCGPLLRTVIQIWDCGDDECGCSQVEVVELHEHRLVPGARWAVQLAKGTFCTDGCGDDGRPASKVWREDIAEARVMFPSTRRTRQHAGGIPLNHPQPATPEDSRP